MLKTLKKLGITKEEYKEWFKHRLNVIVPMGRGEKEKHFLIKALLCKILDDEGYRFVTEYPINGRYVDVFVLDNFMAYEIETTKNNNFKEKLNKRMEEYHKNQSKYLSIYGMKMALDLVDNFSKENLTIIFVKDLPKDFDEIIKELKRIFNQINKRNL